MPSQRRRNHEYYESLSLAAPLAPAPAMELTPRKAWRIRFGDLIAVGVGVAVTAAIIAYLNPAASPVADTSTPDTGTFTGSIDTSRTASAQLVLAESQPQAQDVRGFRGYQDARGDYQSANLYASAQQPTVALSDLQGSVGTISGR